MGRRPHGPARLARDLREVEQGRGQVTEPHQPVVALGQGAPVREEAARHGEVLGREPRASQVAALLAEGEPSGPHDGGDDRTDARAARALDARTGDAHLCSDAQVVAVVQVRRAQSSPAHDGCGETVEGAQVHGARERSGVRGARRGVDDPLGECAPQGQLLEVREVHPGEPVLIGREGVEPGAEPLDRERVPRAAGASRREEVVEATLDPLERVEGGGAEEGRGRPAAGEERLRQGG